VFLEKAKQLYSDMLEKGIAPEQARMVLPQSMYTSYYVTGSLSAFARLYNQRSDSHAQKEIQDVARMIDDIISPLYPVSWQALTKGVY
jgi:thymidylate synthase (FAD)